MGHSPVAQEVGGEITHSVGYTGPDDVFHKKEPRDRNTFLFMAVTPGIPAIPTTATRPTGHAISPACRNAVPRRAKSIARSRFATRSLSFRRAPSIAATMASPAATAAIVGTSAMITAKTAITAKTMITRSTTIPQSYSTGTGSREADDEAAVANDLRIAIEQRPIPQPTSMTVIPDLT